MDRNSAFTLVELAIVIVIIGLLVGGVITGQELISQAKIRSQVKQLQSFDAATATFKAKYGFLPGDIPPNIAGGFGLYQVTCGTCTGGWAPNGNGQINDSGGNVPPLGAWAESRLFFMHLKDAKLIPSSVINTTAALWDVGMIFPEAAIGSGGVAAVSTNDGLYYFFGPTRRNDPSNTNYFQYLSEVPSFTTNEAFGVDSKLDDGIPGQGVVRAINVTGVTATNFSNDVTANNCIGSDNSTYYMQNTKAACRLIIKSST